MSTNFNDLGFSEQLAPKFLSDRTIIKDLAKIKTLYAQLSASTPYATAKDVATPTISGPGYQVPSGKKFIAFGVRSTFNGSSGGYLNIGTSESDPGFNASSGGTNPQFVEVQLIGNTAQAYDASFFSEVPEGKYCLLYAPVGNGGVYATVYGFEIDTDATSI